MKLSKEVRRGFVEGVVIRMDPDDVATLECAIEGRLIGGIEKTLGCMSSNQWRNCLIISLNELIGLEGGHGKNTKKLSKQVKSRKKL